MTRSRLCSLLIPLVSTIACSDGSGGGAPNVAPTVALVVPACVLSGDDVLFDATASSDVDGRIVEYRFVFGDGTAEVRSTAPRARHAYAGPGAYEVALTALDDRGGAGRGTALVRILARAACASDADCADGAFCAGGACQAPDDGGACARVPSGCPAGQAACGTVANNCDATSLCVDGCCRPTLSIDGGAVDGGPPGSDAGLGG